jgi:hypothetical protein
MSADTNHRLESESSNPQSNEVMGQESLFEGAQTPEIYSAPATEASPLPDTDNPEPSVASVAPASNDQETTPNTTTDTSWMRRHKKSLAVGGLVVAVGGGIGAKIATSGSSHSSQPSAVEQIVKPSATTSTSQAPKSTNSPSPTSIPTVSGTNPELSYIQPHYNMLKVPSAAEQTAAIDASDLPDSQKQMAKELVQYGFPFAPGLDYRIDTFKAKGLDEAKAEKAVFLQLVSDYLAAVNTDDPSIIPKMGPGEANWDLTSIKSEFAGVRNVYAFWQVITEDTTGVRDITYKDDGTHITISGTTYLNGVPKNQSHFELYTQDSQTNKTYLTDAEMHVDFTFTLNEQHQLTRFHSETYNN